jgi:transposase
VVHSSNHDRGSYQSVKRFVRKLRGARSPEARVVIETSPGEEAPVDYGSGPMVRDPQSGKYRRTRMFVLTLGYSRKSVRLLSFRSSARTWAELQEKAFRRLGGSTRIVVHVRKTRPEVQHQFRFAFLPSIEQSPRGAKWDSVQRFSEKRNCA